MAKEYSTSYSDYPWLNRKPKNNSSPKDGSSTYNGNKEERVLRPITPKAHKVITPLLTDNPPLSLDEIVEELRSNGLRQGRDYAYSSSIPPKRYYMGYYESYFRQRLGSYRLTSQGIGIIKTSIRKQRSAEETLRLFKEGKHYKKLSEEKV